MPDSRCNRVRKQLAAVRAWPVWELPRWLVAFIAGVIALYAAAVVLTLPGLTKADRVTSCSWPRSWRVLRPQWSSLSARGRTPG